MMNVQRPTQGMAGVPLSRTDETRKADLRDSSGVTTILIQLRQLGREPSCVSSLELHLESLKVTLGLLNARICAIPNSHLFGILRAPSAKPKVPKGHM